MSNLKPCPFCGGEAELCYAPGLGTDSCRGYTLHASCNECGAKSPGLWQEKKPEPDDQNWKDAADEWNSRPGEPDPENCGVAFCEHYSEGLPVCSKCREESTLAHEKAKADAALALNDRALELVNEARADADHWKSECNALQRMVHEARAEIERLSSRDGNAKHELIYDDGDNPFAREKLEHVDFGVCDNQYVLESHLLNNALEGLKAKDKLIEQMREALKGASKHFDRNYWNIKNDPDFEDLNEIWSNIEAALAAERGEL